MTSKTWIPLCAVAVMLAACGPRGDNDTHEPAPATPNGSSETSPPPATDTAPPPADTAPTTPPSDTASPSTTPSDTAPASPPQQ